MKIIASIEDRRSREFVSPSKQAADVREIFSNTPAALKRVTTHHKSHHHAQGLPLTTSGLPLCCVRLRKCESNPNCSKRRERTSWSGRGFSLARLVARGALGLCRVSGVQVMSRALPVDHPEVISPVASRPGHASEGQGGWPAAGWPRPIARPPSEVPSRERQRRKLTEIGSFLRHLTRSTQCRHAGCTRILSEPTSR
jgi:hypothetical protein